MPAESRGRSPVPESLIDRISACLAVVDYHALTELYRSDTVFDANVPYWRFQVRGPEATRRVAEEEMAGVLPVQVTDLRVTPTADGVVVQTEVHFQHHGQEGLWRDIHVIHTDGSRITEHAYYCTGNWDAATIQRQADEAPMVRSRG